MKKVEKKTKGIVEIVKYPYTYYIDGKKVVIFSASVDEATTEFNKLLKNKK